MKSFLRIVRWGALLPLSALLAGPLGVVHAQVWKPSSAPFGYYWSSIASSADGTRLVASAQFDGRSGQPAASGIWVSRDAGASWTVTSAPSNLWSCVACSADGTRLVACETGGSHQPPSSAGGVYISSDSGATWQQSSAPGQLWESVASSADGMTLIGAGSYSADGQDFGSVYVSTDGGVTWKPVLYGWCTSVACSADGSKLFAGPKGYGYVSQLVLSTNAGATWAPISAMAPWQALTCSADGNRLVAAYSRQGSIYTSTNCGTTWTEYQPDPYVSWFKSWDAVASSADGRTLVAAEAGAGIWTSTNAGATWEATGLAVETGTTAASVAVAGNGVRLLAATYAAGPSWQGIWTAINPPTLSLLPVASPAGPTLLLSWPAGSGALLQETSDPAAGNWTTATQAVSLAGDRAQVLVPAAEKRGFYRLVYPY